MKLIIITITPKKFKSTENKIIANVIFGAYHAPNNKNTPIQNRINNSHILSILVARTGFEPVIPRE